MGTPFSIRLPESTITQLEARAAGKDEPPRTLAQRYIEEGLRQDQHPLIRFADGPGGRRAALVGTGLDVWEVVATVKDNNGSVADAAEYLHVKQALVDAAVAYYGNYRAEIDRMIESNKAAAELAHQSFMNGKQAVSE